MLLWAQQILNALSYVQQQGYVHCELKLDNLTVSYTLFSDSGLKYILSKIPCRYCKEINKTFWSPCHSQFCFVTLTTDNKVKLFDVRVIKQEKEIWGALCGATKWLIHAAFSLQGQTFKLKCSREKKINFFLFFLARFVLLQFFSSIGEVQNQRKHQRLREFGQNKSLSSISLPLVFFFFFFSFFLFFFFFFLFLSSFLIWK